MPAIFQAVSAIAASTGADVTVTLPAHRKNDILLLFGWVRDVDDTITTPSGWTAMAGTPFDRGTTARYWAFWKRATSAAETNPLIDKSTATGDTFFWCVNYRRAKETGDPWEVKGTPQAGTADPAVFTGITTLSADALVVALWGYEDNNGASIITTGTDPAAYTEHYAEDVAGDDGCLTVSEFLRTAAGATGDVTVDLNVAYTAGDGWGGMLLALTEAPYPRDVVTNAEMPRQRGYNRHVVRNWRAASNKRFYSFHHVVSGPIQVEWSSDGKVWTNTATSIDTGDHDAMGILARDSGSNLIVYLVYIRTSTNVLGYRRIQIADSDDAPGTIGAHQEIDTLADLMTTEKHAASITRTGNGRLVVAYTYDVTGPYRNTWLAGADGDGDAPTWTTRAGASNLWDDAAAGGTNNLSKGTVWSGLEAFDKGSTQDAFLVFGRVPSNSSTTRYRGITAAPTWNGTAFSGTTKFEICAPASGNVHPIVSALVDSDNRAFIVYNDRDLSQISARKAGTVGDDDWGSASNVKTTDTGDAPLSMSIDTNASPHKLYVFYSDAADNLDFQWKSSPVDTISWSAEEIVGWAADIGETSSSPKQQRGSIMLQFLRATDIVAFMEFAVTADPSGQTIAVGQATETDVANPVAWAPKKRFVNQVLEADVAQAVGRRKTAGVGQVTEADVSQPVTRVKSKTLGQVVEVDAAQVVSWAPKNRFVAQVAEADVSQAVTRVKSRAIGQVVEVDVAQAVGRLKTVAVLQVAEVDLAQTIGRLKTAGVGMVVEVDTAQPVAWAPKRRFVVQVLETDVAQPVTRGSTTKIIAVGQVVETDLALTVARVKSQLLGQVVEVDVANPVAWAPKSRFVALVTETDVAQGVTVVKSYAVHGSLYLHDGPAWDGFVFYFEVSFRATAGTVHARLKNVTDNAEVPGSAVTTSSSTLVRIRSPPISLEDGKEYRAEFGVAPAGTGEFLGARIIAT